MVRLCPTPQWVCLIALLLVGCTGQTIEGRWKAALPYDGATDCRVELFSDARFQLSCSGHAWVGAGRYTRKDSTLRLDFQMLTHGGEVVRDPEPLDYTFVGKGNTIEMTGPSGTTTWTRTMGKD